jgi:hypothetical protein
MVDFETPVCKLYLLFISADAAQEKKKKEKKVLLPRGVSKATAHTVVRGWDPIFCSNVHLGVFCFF